LRITGSLGEQASALCPLVAVRAEGANSLDVQNPSMRLIT
jgi:hypothetical protein